MGYDPNVHTTKPVFRDKQRDGHLGLGAKALLPGEKAQIAGKKKALAKSAPAAASGVQGDSRERLYGVHGDSRGSSAAAASSVAAMASDGDDAEAAAASSEPAQKRPRTDEDA